MTAVDTYRAYGVRGRGLPRSVDPALWQEDRLVGALSSRSAFDARLRTVLAVGVVAVAASGSATSVASEPDQVLEGQLSSEGGGVVAPEPPAGPQVDAPADSPDAGTDEGESEPDGGQEGDVGALGDAPGQEDSVPLETEPVDDPYGRLVLTSPEAPAAPVTEEAPESLSETLPPGEDPAPPAPPAPAPLGPVPPAAEPQPQSGLQGESEGQPSPPDSESGVQRDNRRRVKERGPAEAPKAKSRGPQDAAPPDLQERSSGSPGPGPAVEPAPSAPAAGAAPSAPTEEPAPSATPPAPHPTRLSPNARFHVVRPGESLWSIATALLGPGASPREITHEVHRLWRLNSAGIGTGDPNLLPVGVRLRLR